MSIIGEMDDPWNWNAIIFAVALVSAGIFGWLGSWVARQCGREPIEGAILGVFFGPFGVIVEGLLPKFPYEKQIRDSSPPADVVRDEKVIREWHRTH